MTAKRSTPSGEKPITYYNVDYATDLHWITDEEGKIRAAWVVETAEEHLALRFDPLIIHVLREWLIEHEPKEPTEPFEGCINLEGAEDTP